MSRKRNDALMQKMALAVASGQAVTHWARANDVSAKTAGVWSRIPEFRELVDSHRRAVLDRTVGKLTRHATKAVDKIARLADGAESEGVRLNAAKVILDKLLEVSSHVEAAQVITALQARIADLEKTLESDTTKGPTCDKT